MTLPERDYVDYNVKSSSYSVEDKKALRLIACEFIQRMIACPELAPMGYTEDVLKKMLVDNYTLNQEEFQKFAVHAEAYFRLKDDLASQGYKIFDAYIEYKCSSDSIRLERANMMVDYFKLNQHLLPDAISYDILTSEKFVELNYNHLSLLWCYVYDMKLKGVNVSLLDNSDPRSLSSYSNLAKLRVPRE